MGMPAERQDMFKSWGDILASERAKKAPAEKPKPAFPQRALRHDWTPATQ